MHIFSSAQAVYDFWLVHLIHVHLHLMIHNYIPITIFFIVLCLFSVDRFFLLCFLPRTLYTARHSFRFDGEIQSFSDKQKLKEFSTTKPALQQMLKELL